MAKQKGAVVALDPTTGAILAAVSLPSYDPNMLSSHDTAAITAYWKSLNPDDPQSALVNRAFNMWRYAEFLPIPEGYSPSPTIGCWSITPAAR